MSFPDPGLLPAFSPLPRPRQALGCLGIPGQAHGGRGGTLSPGFLSRQPRINLAVSLPGQGQGNTPPQAPRALPLPRHGILNRAECMAPSGGWLRAGGHRERRVTKLCLAFCSGLPGANECTEPQPGGSQRVFILLCLFSV